LRRIGTKMKSITVGTVRLRVNSQKGHDSRYHQDPVRNPVIEQLAEMFGIVIPMTLSLTADVCAYEIGGTVLSVLPSTRTIDTDSGKLALTEVILQGPLDSPFWVLLNIAYAAARK